MPVAAEHRGTGRPRLVLIHGFTQTGRSWARIAERLAVVHEVVTVDAPGHAGSTDVAAPDLVAGAEQIVDAAGPGVYVGYSMGGRYALAAALARPATVTGLVLLGAHPGIEDPAERRDRRRADDELAATIERDGVDAFLERWLSQPLFASLPAAAADRDDRRRNTAAGLATSLRTAGTGTQTPMWDRLPELHLPVLAVAGEHDAKFTALARRLTTAIGPTAELAIVPGAGHAAHLEHPDAFVAAVEAWLTSAVPPR